MKTTSKAIIRGGITEAIAASFVVIDARIGIGAATRVARDQAPFDGAVQAVPHIFCHLAQWTHWPAVIVLSIFDWFLQAILGLSGGKPLFSDGFGTGSPAWGLICLAQAFIRIAFWAFIFIVARSIRRHISRVHQYA